jgi:hypothetical protein
MHVARNTVCDLRRLMEIKGVRRGSLRLADNDYRARLTTRYGEDFMKRLGKESDGTLSDAFGVKRSYICLIRKRLGILSYTRGGPKALAKIEKLRAQLAKAEAAVKAAETATLVVEAPSVEAPAIEVPGAGPVGDGT